MSSFNLEVDREQCMGAQRCLFLAPEVFDLDDEGIAVVLDASGLSADRAEELAGECPNLAISVTPARH